ncbi:30S ribosomal protein S1, partial [Rhizobium ruizarguesonis]
GLDDVTLVELLDDLFAWTVPVEVGEVHHAVKAVVLDVDVEKERISLGIKQLGKDAVGDAAASGDLRKNAVVSCEVIAV